MKRLTHITLTLGLFLSLFGCGNNNDNTPTVPGPDPACMTGAAYCNGQMYSAYPGFYNYPNGYNSYQYSQQYYTGGSTSFCDCPAGTMPTYNSSYGLGCVSTNQFGYNFSLYAYLGWGNNQWTRAPQISNITGAPGVMSNGCYSNAVQSCFIDVPGSCGANRICQPTASSGRLGLCSGTSALSGYR